MVLSEIPIALSAGFANGLEPVVRVIADDLGRIAWNSFLALVPLTLSFFLFHKPRWRVFCWGTYSLLLLSFIIGIKRYNDGNFLEALQRFLASLWGVRLFFIAIAIGIIISLLILDRRWRASMQIDRRSSLFWWAGLFLFLAFLPNAPYILTDIIHFYDAVRTINSVWSLTLIVLPTYILFIGVGWFSYVYSLVNLCRYLDSSGLDRWANVLELILHFLCAIGIYIGRFLRFNSWDLVAHPRQFLYVLPGELLGKFPIAVILLTFLIITVLYAMCKPLVTKSSLYQSSSGL